MSRDGQAARPLPAGVPAGVVVPIPAGGGFAFHTHPAHQLAWASAGVLALTAEHAGRSRPATYVLPIGRALWIPAGTRHAVGVHGATTMHSAYLDPADCGLTWTAPTVVDAGDLVTALATRLSDESLAGAERRRTEAVLWDVLTPVEVTTLDPTRPTDDRARVVADGILADLTDHRSLAAWGREAGASGRTLARLFVAETGLGFERWRTHARLAAALPRLAAGVPVGTVAFEVGYASPSAFVAAFRRELGTTPSTFAPNP